MPNRPGFYTYVAEIRAGPRLRDRAAAGLGNTDQPGWQRAGIVHTRGGYAAPKAQSPANGPPSGRWLRWVPLTPRWRRTVARFVEQRASREIRPVSRLFADFGLAVTPAADPRSRPAVVRGLAAPRQDHVARDHEDHDHNDDWK